MTTTQELLIAMFKENTGRSILDSGDYYGRNWQINQDKDFSKIPQATMRLDKWGPEVTVSSYRHCLALLELDVVCEAFNAIPVDDWKGDYYGVSERGQEFLDRIGATVEDCWNTYNWDTNFDQIMQGHRVYINDEEYTLLQIHGGCDARGGYTDARLFKLNEWDGPDYWLMDDAEFCINVPTDRCAETPDMIDPEFVEHDYIVVEVQASRVELYKPGPGTTEEVPDGFFEQFPHQKIEGVQRAVEH